VVGIPGNTETSLVAPHPPTVKRDAKVSRPCSSATVLRKAPQAETMKRDEAMENTRPSLPVGPPGRAFRRRQRTNTEVACPALCLDMGEIVENTDGGRDSSLARCYDVLGAQVFSIGDRPESDSRPPSTPAQNLKRCGRPLRSMSRGSNSAKIATPPAALDHSSVSAMTLDLGDSVNTVVEVIPCRPTHVQKLRAISVGGAHFGKKGGPQLLPSIKPKATGQRQAHSVSSCRTNHPLAWNLGISRRNLDSIGAVF